MKKNSRRQGKGSIKTFRFVLFTGTGITFALILLIIILGDQQFGPVHKVILEGAGPLQKAVAKISDSVHSVKRKYIDLLTVREEKERLWRELQECRTTAYANRGAVALNARLRKLLDFKESSNQPTITAQIIGKRMRIQRFRFGSLELKQDKKSHRKGKKGQKKQILPVY
ncbi:MAG: hypothetical protein D3922_09370 [Candidatus Electrothrix sp. AR1]|nr:hypothetical protein [Candidatus Electrothrix sp. AR1]